MAHRLTVPSHWPFPCPECGKPANPRIAEPWYFEAYGAELKYKVEHEGAGDDGSGDSLVIWRLQDATRRKDAQAMTQASAAFRDMDEQHRGERWWPRSLGYQILVSATEDSRAVAEIVAHWLTITDPDQLGHDSTRKEVCSPVLEAAISFLATPGGSQEPLSGDIRQKCLQLAGSVYEILGHPLQQEINQFSRAN